MWRPGVKRSSCCSLALSDCCRLAVRTTVKSSAGKELSLCRALLLPVAWLLVVAIVALHTCHHLPSLAITCPSWCFNVGISVHPRRAGECPICPGWDGEHCPKGLKRASCAFLRPHKYSQDTHLQRYNCENMLQFSGTDRSSTQETGSIRWRKRLDG